MQTQCLKIRLTSSNNAGSADTDSEYELQQFSEVIHTDVRCSGVAEV